MRAGAIRRRFDLFDRQLRRAGYLAMGGQIVDASLVSAPRQSNSRNEKAAIKTGKSASEIWPDDPAEATQKDTDARWTVKIGRPRDKDAQRSVPELASPVFGYKSHIYIDNRFGSLRGFAVISAAAHDGKMLRQVVGTDITASDVWAETAYRSKANEAWLESKGRTSRIHHKKPKPA